MGYYSFYKIIKDIFRTIFGNKALKFTFIFLLVFFILFLFNKNKVSAVSSLELKDGSITLPAWIDGSTYNAYIFQSEIDENGYYNFVTVFTRGGGNLKLGTYSGSTAFTNTGNGQSIQNRSNKITTFNGTVSQYQSYLNSNFGWTTGSTGNSNMYWATWITYPNLSTYGVDAENCYINGTRDILNTDNSVYIEGNSLYIPDSLVELPEIANSLSDLESLNFDVISVNGRAYSNKDFDILFYDRNVKDTNSTEGLYPKRVITLNQNTSYFQADLTADPNKNAIYWIPIDEIGLNLYIGGTYEIRLAERVPLDPPQFGADYYYNYLGDPVRFTISSDVSQDKINAINKEIEDTTNKKYHDETINKMDTINNNINNLNNNINNVNDALTNTTPDSSVSSDIDNSLNFNNQNEGLNNLNGGFFSRLTTMLSNLLGYNLAEDTSVSLPLPNSNKSIVLHSKDIYDNVTGALRLIINAFWIYIFSFYMWKFINKIYIAVSTGNILDTFSSSGEAITNDML